MRVMAEKLIIGPSTGWIYAHGIFDIRTHEKIVRESGANTLEMCVGSDEERINGLLRAPRFLGLTSVFAHLDYNPKKSLDEQVEIFKKLYFGQVFNNSANHPNEIPEKYWEKLSATGIPVSIENMDKNKKSGFNIEELNNLMKRFNLGFVLDVQHAYEHDTTMREYAYDLLQMGKEKLKYLHVSGETENNNHALLHQANNASQIISFLGDIFSVKNVPIILEGKYKDSDELKLEIDFIKKELGFD